MATFDRLPLLEAQCHSYPGPLSAALYLPLRFPRAHGHARRRKLRDWSAPGSPARLQQRHVINHMADLEGAIKRLQEAFNRLESQPSACSLVLMLFTERVLDDALSGLMPTNTLRNAALLAVTTPMAAMIDVDLSASKGLANLASNATRVSELATGTLRDRILWIIPAWEASSKMHADLANQVVDLALAGDKARLASLYRSDTVALAEELLRANSASSSNSSREDGDGGPGAEAPDAAAGSLPLGGRRIRGSIATHRQGAAAGRKRLSGRPLRAHSSASGRTSGFLTGPGSSQRRRQLHGQAGSREFEGKDDKEEEEEDTEERAPSGPVFPFDSETFWPGHGPTDFDRFLRADQPYRVEYANAFEPWYMAARDAILPYDERLRGWYGDKVQQVLYSILRGYRFWVLPDVWIIHRPHKPVAARSITRNETGAPSKDVEALSQLMRWQFLPRTVFKLYKTRARNLEFRLVKLTPWNMYSIQLGSGFQRCRASLPWWQKRG